MMKPLVCLFIVLIYSSLSFAQGYVLDGVIIDGTDHSTLMSAVVKLTDVADTTKWVGAAADIDGKFTFTNVASGSYKMQVTYIGYQMQEIKVSVEGADKHLGTLSMARSSTTLKDVNVEARADRVTQKADTTEYNANSFKTNPDANAEDLVTKMPGITSDNGTVKAQGETVQKVYVDGKEFFGDDATLALKNLPAEIIDKVQVFDKLSDQSQFTGFDDGNTQKAINITTKRGKNNGVFGKVYGGYGYLTDHRYSASAVINWFKGDRRISLLGMSNNVNQQNFATQDLLGVVGTTTQRGGGASGGGRRPSGNNAGGSSGGSSVNNFLVGQQGGISTTHSAGINYADLWGAKKKVKVTGSYFFNLTDNENTSELTRQYFNAGDSSTYYKETNSTNSRNINHRINLRVEYAIDSMNKLVFTPKINIQQNNQTNNVLGQTTLAQSEFLGQSQSLYKAKNFGYNLGGDILYQHKFNKPRRTLSIDIVGTFNDKNGNTSLSSQNKFDNINDSTDIEQQANISSNSYSVSGNITYSEPAGKTGIVMLNYTPSNTWSHSDKETFNIDTLTGNYNALDTILSNKFDNIYMTHRGGASYRITTKKLNFMVGINAQYAYLSGKQTFPISFLTKRSFINVLPTAMFNYKFSTTSNLRINYRTSTNPPSISQLQNVIDNSNPLLLSTGNPNLRQAYTHSLALRYGLTNQKSAQSFFAFVSATYTQNYIGNSTTIATSDTVLQNDIILHAGSQLSQPVNLNGSLNLNGLLTYGFPIDKIKCNMNFTAGASYIRTPSLINNITNLANTYNINGGVVLSSNINENIDFTLSYTGNYNIVKNSAQTSSNNNYYSHNANLKFNWQFWKGFVFNTGLQNKLFAGVSQGFNQNILLWNASLGYKFLKDKSLEVKASVNDILNQNNGIARTVNETYVEDSKTQVLKRYLLVTVTYTLRYFKK